MFVDRRRRTGSSIDQAEEDARPCWNRHDENADREREYTYIPGVGV